jgi:hypothetical protein
MEQSSEELAHWDPKPPLMEVSKGHHIAGWGFGWSSLPGSLHSGYATSVFTGQSNPLWMRSFASLWVKDKRDHGSILVIGTLSLTVVVAAKGKLFLLCASVGEKARGQRRKVWGVRWKKQISGLNEEEGRVTQN